MNDTLTELDRFDLRPRAKGNLLAALRALFGPAPRASRPAAKPALDY